MQFWIIEDGEKRGPFEDYELREMVRRGRVTEETRVWHQEADDWCPARELHLLERDFEPREEAVPPPLPAKITTEDLWRRLGARWFDFMLFQLLIILVMRLGGVPLLPTEDYQPSFWVVLSTFVPAILLEGIFIHLYGFTPGKWFLRLKLTTCEGSHLSLGASVIRSMRVWILGLGMGWWPILLFLGHVIALWMVRKKGAPLWDLVTGYQVKGPVLSAARITLFVILLITLFALSFLLIWPEIQPLLPEGT